MTGKEQFGRIVRVRTEYVDGSGYLARIWYVALDDDQGAMDAVRGHQGTTAGDLIDVLGQLEPDHVRKIGLGQGEALAYP